jgi:hypothetical protein
MANTLNFTSVKPQHIRTIITDSTSKTDSILTIYTGQLSIGHGAGDDRKGVDIVYPILGLFIDTAGKAVPGIVPLLSAAEFKGAVAMAAVSDFVDKTDVAVWQVRDVRADLCAVTINLHPLTKIFAVVLRLVAEAQNSEIGAVQYQVTVLSQPQPSRSVFTPPETPILVNSSLWDGAYHGIGNSVVGGVPNL